MAKLSDAIDATVEVRWSNIGEEWNAELVTPSGEVLAHGRAKARSNALRNLADAIDERDGIPTF